MGNGYKDRHQNVYFRTRKYASESNENLVSREETAELLGISPSSLADYELDKTKVVPADKVKAMADLYNAPELLNWYCTHECPIGIGKRLVSEPEQIDKAVLRLIVSIHNGMDFKVLDRLMTIAVKNMTDFEVSELEEVIEILEDIAYAISGVTVIGEKVLRWSDDERRQTQRDT